jgi:tripartite-type tricarboxylate transporter receptor subunit TctC
MGTKFVRISICVASIAIGAAAQAQSPAEFYKNKTINMMVGYPPGGGYDVYARVIAGHMAKHIPGTPNIVVRNRPGAASLVLVNELYAASPQDGTVIGTFARSVAMDRLLGRQGANFVPTELNWLGSANNEVSICTVWHGLQIKSAADFMSRGIIFGANASGSESDVYPNILNNLLGAKFKIVTGYPGANDLMLAIERGEIQGRCGWTWSAAKTTRADWIADNKLYIAVQFATEKHPELPDVPLVLDLARSDKERQALELILAGQKMGRPFAAPPNVPADRVDALRRAFDATMRDPAFLAEADKQKLEVQPVTGEALQQTVAAMFKAEPAVVEAARQAIEPAKAGGK